MPEQRLLLLRNDELQIWTLGDQVHCVQSAVCLVIDLPLYDSNLTLFSEFFSLNEITNSCGYMPVVHQNVSWSLRQGTNSLRE